MTDVKIVDASAVAAMVFQEPEAGDVAARLDGSRLIAPRLLMIELANVCAMKCRRHPEDQAAHRAAFALLPLLGIEEVEMVHERVLDLALETGLTAYDASYLWLARQAKAELVTLDKALLKAALSEP